MVGEHEARADGVRPVPRLVTFNDAGIGKDSAGIGRLPLLQRRGIAALTVSAHSARIGASSQAPSSVMTRMMPVGEYISWMRSCECASWRWPSS